MVRNFIILLIFILGANNPSKASHLVGGSLRYEFIQSVDTDNNGFIDAVDYRIIMNYYYNCDATANNVYENASLTNPQWMPGGSQYTIEVGLYAHDDPTTIYPQTVTSYPKYGSELVLSLDTLKSKMIHSVPKSI